MKLDKIPVPTQSRDLSQTITESIVPASDTESRKGTGALLVCPISSKNWILVESFSFKDGQGGIPDEVQVPERFITDFASIPRPFWFFLPTWGEYGWAAVIHDWLYWEQPEALLRPLSGKIDTGQLVSRKDHFKRKIADQAFFNGMVKLGVSLLKRNIIYWTVRVFGYWAWRNNAKIKKRDPQNRIIDELPGNPFEAKAAGKKYYQLKKATLSSELTNSVRLNN